MRSTWRKCEYVSFGWYFPKQYEWYRSSNFLCSLYHAYPILHRSLELIGGYCVFIHSLIAIQIPGFIERRATRIISTSFRTSASFLPLLICANYISLFSISISVSALLFGYAGDRSFFFPAICCVFLSETAYVSCAHRLLLMSYFATCSYPSIPSFLGIFLICCDIPLFILRVNCCNITHHFSLIVAFLFYISRRYLSQRCKYLDLFRFRRCFVTYPILKYPRAPFR